MECLASKEKRKVYRIECCETDFCNNNKLLDMATYARGIHTKQSFRFKPIRHYINYFLIIKFNYLNTKYLRVHCDEEFLKILIFDYFWNINNFIVKCCACM